LGEVADTLTAMITAASATISRTKVSKRFPNSIHACKAPSACPGTGVYEPGVHSGQVGHPSPDPVIRTAPPVTIKEDWKKINRLKIRPWRDFLVTSMI
jgi:hypothetical protein